MAYERAAALRDKLRSIERTMESQKMAARSDAEADLVGLAREANDAAVQLFVVREGKLVGRDVFLLTDVAGETDATVIGAFIKQYYATAGSVPRRVLTPVQPVEAEELATMLGERRGGRVELAVPQRGRNRQLLELAARNAAETLAREQARWLADAGKTLAALEELADALGLAAPPARIECYDISTIQGSNTVGSMVVFEDGRPRTGEYRRFRVRTVQGPNDFASHQEVLRRRFGHALRLEEGAVEEARWRLPDLVIIDGGKGQVSAAREVLDALGLHDLPLAGLAKEREELFLPDRSDPDPAVTQLAGPLPRPAPARRGPPLRHHLPPPAAGQGPGPLGARRPARHRPGAQAGPAAGLRLGTRHPRGDRVPGGGRTRHRPAPGGDHQGDPGGLSTPPLI